MKQSLALTLLILSSLFSHAAFVPKKTAEKAAFNHYLERIQPVRETLAGQIRITGYQSLGQGSVPLIHVFTVNHDRGFVLVAAEDNSIPILGYSFEGEFVTENMPAHIQSWMDGYLAQLGQLRETQLPAATEIKAQWERLTSSGFQPSKDITGVSPLLTTNWDQGCFYNALCPVAPADCNHAWAGCVATAMGMVMKYHNYPAQGTGSYSYAHPTYGNQSANFGATTYNWSAMPNALNYQNASVATLLYHCGVSVDMDYGVSGSGAYTQDTRNSLINFFNYSTDAQYVQKFSYSSAGWENLLRNNLDAHRPVIYSGQDPSYGHAFVCDGYQGTNHFHFNWGWSGWNNGYFYVNNLNSGNGTFNTNQAAVVNIHPANTPTATFSASQTAFCAGATVQFTDISTGNPVSWNWQFPGGNPASSTQQNPSVTYSNPGLYDVILTVTSVSGSHTVTKSGYIKPAALPVAPFPPDTTICCNNTITLDAGNPGAAYAWSTGQNTQTITLDSTGTGIGQTIINVSITLQGCQHQTAITVDFAACAGTWEYNDLPVTLLPNPATDLVRMNFPGGFTSRPAMLRIFATDGTLIREQDLPLNADTWQLETMDMPRGMYLILLEQDSRRLSTKLILE